jgi:hypothetical protein
LPLLTVRQTNRRVTGESKAKAARCGKRQRA